MVRCRGRGREFEGGSPLSPCRGRVPLAIALGAEGNHQYCPEEEREDAPCSPGGGVQQPARMGKEATDSISPRRGGDLVDVEGSRHRGEHRIWRPSCQVQLRGAGPEGKGRSARLFISLKKRGDTPLRADLKEAAPATK